jgi:glycosyltransferase involved in cell wall biosynthesis
MRYMSLLFILAAATFGYWMGGGLFPKQAAAASVKHIHPEKDFPLTDYKSFAILVYAHNDAEWCERALRSIFEQDYERYRVIFVDDGSNDGTYDKAKSNILENNQDQRVVMIQNERCEGMTYSLYHSMDILQDQEIVIPLSAKDWLSHPLSLKKLNLAYQNPDVWVAHTSSLLYPTYEIQDASPTSFYAALFKKIRLTDLFSDGRFVAASDAYKGPLLSLAGGRIRSLKELLFMTNLSRSRKEAPTPPTSSYEPLAAFPSSPAPGKADILIFSCDRPLQLYSCLESIHRYFRGFEKLSVLYRSSDERVQESYKKVQEAFPKVHFVAQGVEYKKDFKPLLLKTLFGSSSEYIIFGVDDIIAKDFVDLKGCMEMMERTGSYGFYLRFGSHIRHCYQSGQAQEVPKSALLNRGVHVWSLKAGGNDWEFPNTLDMTLYRKKDIRQAFEMLKYKTPNSLEFVWAQKPGAGLGLYFETSKIVNVPLNVVSRTGNPHMNMTAEELLVKFEEGLKIDIEPLYQVENASPHFEYTPEFIPR